MILLSLSTQRDVLYKKKGHGFFLVGCVKIALQFEVLAVVIMIISSFCGDTL